MTKMRWDRSRKQTPTRFRPSAGFTTMMAMHAREMRGMTTNDVRQIATDAKGSAPIRALAWRELKQRQPTRHRQPIFITSGMRPDGTLIVFEFATHQAAAAAGFPWAGLSRTVEQPPTGRTRRQ